MEQRPVCLSVGGSDSCAGAGIQADLRVFESLEVVGCSAITALTAQNPDNILHIQASSIEQFTAELQAITNYYDVRCIKTGMLYDQAHVNALLPFLHNKRVVIDPVLIASSGKLLFDKETARTAYEKLTSYATLWTPNLEEAAFFLEADIGDTRMMAQTLANKYQVPVLLKGGHGKENILEDILCADGKLRTFTHHKRTLSAEASHGTGCRLASAIAAYLAIGHDLNRAIEQAHTWLQNDLQQSTI